MSLRGGIIYHYCVFFSIELPWCWVGFESGVVRFQGFITLSGLNVLSNTGV